MSEAREAGETERGDPARFAGWIVQAARWPWVHAVVMPHRNRDDLIERDHRLQPHGVSISA